MSLCCRAHGPAQKIWRNVWRNKYMWISETVLACSALELFMCSCSRDVQLILAQVDVRGKDNVTNMTVKHTGCLTSFGAFNYPTTRTTSQHSRAATVRAACVRWACVMCSWCVVVFLFSKKYFPQRSLVGLHVHVHWPATAAPTSILNDPSKVLIWTK